MKWFVFISLFCFKISFSQTVIKPIVYFETDKYSLTKSENSRLLLFLNEVESLDINKITVYGFCDDRGSELYNLKLSENRVNTIKTLLTTSEFEESLMSNIEGKGELLLQVNKDSEVKKTRGLNRKVEIVVSLNFPQRNLNADTSELEKILNGNLSVGDKILLDNLLFKRGYSYLIPESKKLLNTIAKILSRRSDVYFTIEGHVCCTNGSRDAIDGKTKKRNLSYARAKYVYDYLSNKGISKRRMKFMGMQRKFPLGGPQRLDRRVELLVTKIDN
jgi:outer membrane protein OmpA-like peptidoglycan-associated protein